jgi:hypothetical protein
MYSEVSRKSRVIVWMVRLAVTSERVVLVLGCIGSNRLLCGVEKATGEATTRVVLAQRCHSLTRTLKQPRCFGGTPSQGVTASWNLVFVLLSPAGRNSLVLQVELVDASILRFTTAGNRTTSEHGA